MYNSQLAKRLTKLCKVLAVALCVTLTLQQTSAKADIENVAVKPVPALNPDSLQDALKDAYNQAKFLTIVDTAEKIEHTNQDILCLAKNIYYEAGHEASLGKMAVAQVTLNRTKDTKFAGTICKVVLAPNQFDWAKNKHMRIAQPKGPAWDDSVRVAKEALDGKRVKGLENALFFHASMAHPHWKRVIRLAQIGTQVFYVRA